MISLGIVTAAVLAAGAPARPSSLEAAYKREVALLEAERDALREARAKVDAGRAVRAASLRKELAVLEASLTAQKAKNDALAAELSALERAASVDQAALAPILSAARLTLRRAGASADGADLNTLLESATQALARGATVRRVASGFFDADGSFVDGTIVEVGAVAAVGASPTSAGPLTSAGDGARQVASDEHTSLARRFVESGTGSLPLLLGAEGTDGGPVAPAEEASFVDELKDAGPSGVAVLFLGVLLVGAGAVRALRLLLTRRRVTQALGRVVELVEGGEIGAAEALCRTVGGAGGRLWTSVVAASGRASLDEVEESAADALLDVQGSIARNDRFAAAGAVVLVLLGAGAAVASVGRSLWALENALALAVPVVVLVALSRSAGDRLERELERGALKIVDAARRARSAGRKGAG